MRWRLVEADCVEAMAAMPEASVDAVVTDPPYGIGFMGHEWDQPGEFGPIAVSRTANQRFQAWCEAWSSEALRVLKPGGHLLVFGGTRTWHRLASGLEDAGFEIRDTICWLYGSGFPKSLDVSKAIDKAAGAGGSWRREDHPGRAGVRRRVDSTSIIGQTDYGAEGNERHVYEPETDAARDWQGWGTALKPAFEPIVVARKPLSGTVAATVLEHGTGALNVDGCRIGTGGHLKATTNEQGRWPANVVFDEAAAAMLDEQSGESKSSGGKGEASQRAALAGDVYGDYSGATLGRNAGGLGDSGGASRFFYCAKASRAERNAGLVECLPRARNARKRWQQDAAGRWVPRARNRHPTVKPVGFMRWLVRLVTPPGGTVCDPFAGSGTTGIACVLEGFGFVGVERDAEYVRIARARIAFAGCDPAAFVPELRALRAAPRPLVLTAEQHGLFDDDAVGEVVG